jgi:hypothetical protein
VTRVECTVDDVCVRGGELARTPFGLSVPVSAERNRVAPLS